MERDVKQLVEMGATAAQARAALKQYKDVMQAAERIFDGAFDDILDETDMRPENAIADKKARMITPDEDPEEDVDMDGDGEDDEEEDYMEDYQDYDSDYEPRADDPNGASTADPYAGVFFSKDRREEVIEIEEEPESAFIANEQVKLMTQGQWMKGCPEGGEQSFLFSLYRELSEGECPCPDGCGISIPRSKREFFGIFSEFSAYIEHLQQTVVRRCKGCSKSLCLACGESVSPNSSGDYNERLFHCANLQGTILGVGLAMLEGCYLDETQPTPGECILKPRTHKKRKVSATPTPIATDAEDDECFMHPLTVGTKSKSSGIGYAGGLKEDTSGQTEALALQRTKDLKLATLLSQIRVYLPSLHRPDGGKSSDYLPHPTTLAHLRRRFNFVSSQLLRNDSLADMSDRAVLYFELLEWLETISCHEALAGMMAMPIMVVSSVKTVVSRKSAGNPVRERTLVYEGSSGPRELLEAIVIQAQAALKGLEPNKGPDGTIEDAMTEEQKRMTLDDKGKGKDILKTVSEENAKLLGFCKRILSTARAIDKSLRDTKGDAFVNRLHVSLPKIPGTSSSSNIEGPELLVDIKGSEQDVQKAYMEWANRVRFEYCDLTIPPVGTVGEDETPHFKFYYNAEARLLVYSDIPKRSLAIAKELAVLTTNLPVAWDSSIFLRVDETRVDVIKALITGPKGTPYYNGCYLFDIFLGPSYNQAPPSVKYITTGGGKYRFNPNLYSDGKVCLSLLGTWQGPGWIAGKSTLLQVLISIQSMILCDEPYLNEPGWANSAGTPASKQYSANVRRMVVKIAMLSNLKNPPEPFAEVIRTHYRLKARSIIKQLDQWLAEDDGNSDGANISKGAAGGSSNGFNEDVDHLKEILQRLHDGQDISAAISSSSRW